MISQNDITERYKNFGFKSVEEATKEELLTMLFLLTDYKMKSYEKQIDILMTEGRK